MIVDIKEFNFKEMFNNSQGKTVLGLVLSFIFGVVAALGLLLCGIVIVFETHSTTTIKTDITSYCTQCVVVIGLVIGYITGRRFSKDEPIIENK